MSLGSDKTIQENCGLVGIFNKNFVKSVPQALTAATGLQHRGQQGAGIAILTKTGIKKYVGDGFLQDVFASPIVDKLNKPCRWVLVHGRYGTYGGYQKYNLQPCMAKSKDGEVVVIHNGQFVKTGVMRKKIKKTFFLKEASDTYLFTQMLAKTKGRSWDEKITSALSQIDGAYSLLIAVKDAVYVARDQSGIRPLVMGRSSDSYVFASETYALSKIGVKVDRSIKGSEILKVDRYGLHILSKGQSAGGNFCDFEWAYFSRPNSLFPVYRKMDDDNYPQRWLSFAVFRERCGEILAEEAPINNASFVVGVPDSGVLVAMGYANKLKLPYRQAIIRDHFDPDGLQRLFMRDDRMEEIGNKVLGKLSLVPDGSIWKDAIVVVGDDSIVRGNVSSMVTKAIFSQGAKQVHWIVGFPPVNHPCHLGVSMRTKRELIAPKMGSNPQKIAQAIGATSVSYISYRGFIQAREGLNKVEGIKNQVELFLQSNGCGGCLTGLYPVDKKGKRWKSSKTLT